jgi:hypothetical protein
MQRLTVIEITQSAASVAARRRRLPLRRPDKPVRLSVTAAFALFVLLGLPLLMSAYYTGYKLSVWALASFITGVAGGVLAGQARYLYSINFTTQDSITLLVVALMGGVYSLWGAVIATLLMQLLPAFLQNLGTSARAAPRR